MPPSATATEDSKPQLVTNELAGFRGELIGDMERRSGVLYFIRVTHVRSVDDGSKAAAPEQAVGKLLIFDTHGEITARSNKELDAVMRGFAVGDSVLLRAAHYRGGRLSITAAPRRASAADKQPKPSKPGPEPGEADGTFFGIPIPKPKESPVDVPPELRQLLQDALRDVAAERYDEGLAKLRSIKSKLPPGVQAPGLDDTIEQAKRAAKIAAFKRRFQVAIAQEREGNFAAAAAVLRELKAQLPQGIQATGLEESIVRVQEKTETHPELIRIHERIDAAVALGETDARAGLERLQAIASEMSPDAVYAPRLNREIALLKAKLSPTREKPGASGAAGEEGD